MLPTDAQARKAIPIFSGFVKYFPDAIAAVAQLSAIANEQHNPGEPLHWAKEKSTDELDALMRHLDDISSEGVDGRDTEGVLHAAKVAWRALANLQRLADAGADIFAQLPAQAVDGKFNRNFDTTKFGRINATSEPIEQHAQYCVRFGDKSIGGLMHVIYKGPFSDMGVAERYAQENPQNYAGIKTIHALNRP